MIIGGKHITGPAGHYPTQLAKEIVLGIEEEFDVSMRSNDVLAVDDADENGEEPELLPDAVNVSDSSDDEQVTAAGAPKVPAAVRQAVSRLHANTGHRSNRRLARALVIAGAPAEVVQAAKTLKCSICAERKRPKAQRPASLPAPKDVGDQVHVDLFELFDIHDNRFYVAHAIDFVSRFQMAQVLPDKSSDSVVEFLSTRWLPIFGPPRVMIADQGKEFTSWTFEELCARHGILLWHCAVQAPWQNGVCERGGGVLKALATAVI